MSTSLLERNPASEDTLTLQHLANVDVSHAVEIVDRVWWVGHIIEGDPFQCHVYLIEQGDQSVLIDLGAAPSFPFVQAKVEEVLPFENVRWFVCQHQDPDVCGALTVLDAEVSRRDAQIVTDWRAESIIKHYGSDLPFWRIEQNGFRLELEDRTLRFVLTPYLHFPGAFVSFDDKSGLLFSSDLFGGFISEASLLAGGEDYFEKMRLFHEHYMPSREILQHGLSRLRDLPMRAIAPQHGSLIPEALIDPIIERLSTLECGLYRMAEETTDVVRLTEVNRALRHAMRSLTDSRDFPDLMRKFTASVRSGLPVDNIELFSAGPDGAVRFGPEDEYAGVSIPPDKAWIARLRVPRDQWDFADGLTTDGHGRQSIVLPLYGPDEELPHSAARLNLASPIEMCDLTRRILREVSGPLGVAVERQMLFRQVQNERARFRRLSIYDALTGLRNRYALQDAAQTLFAMHERGQVSAVAVSMYDLDHFKSVNDTYGHSAGDEVLAGVGEIMREVSRDGDLVFRVGGEELLSIHVHSDGNATALGERIRARLESHEFGDKLEGASVTVSVGVVSLDRGEALDAVLERADRALYSAKSQGRNRVVFEDLPRPRFS